MMNTDSIKLLAVALVSITLAGGAIGTGILFGSYIIALAKNPDETDALFSASLIGFALIETFVFMGVGVGMFILFL